jgi:hypothetical protein
MEQISSSASYTEYILAVFEAGQVRFLHAL